MPDAFGQVHVTMLKAVLDLLWEGKRRLTNPVRRDFPGAEPLISGDDFRCLAHFVFDDQGLSFLPSQVFRNGLVFVKAYPPLLDYFFRQIHPRIRHPYRLLTHNEDRPMPGEHEGMLEDPKIIHWYSTNISCVHSKVTAIPIGILNLRANADNSGNLLEVMAAALSKQDRTYLNFHIGGENERPEYRKHRQDVYDRFRDCSWVSVSERVPPKKYLEEIARHRFVISPPGHGPDCYRHWESMYLGSIPVVERSINMDCFADFPMILIDDWSQVTPEFLEHSAKDIEGRSFDRNRLYFGYWKNLLSPYRLQASC